MSKSIVIIGITGNQGGSVADSFISDPQWRIRGLTRDLQSEASKSLSEQGVEMVQGDLNDPESLTSVFKGANLVFSVTDFWKPYFDPKNHARAKELGKSIGRYAYELEYEQGKNIVDAVAKEIEGLDEVGLVASTLSNARKASNGKYQELWHFDGKADVFPDYVENYPALAKKTSYLHTGYFYTSWQILPQKWFAKGSDGSIKMSVPTRPDLLTPHLQPRKDTGPFVRALLQLPPTSTLMAASEWCTWPDWIKQFGEVTGVKTSFQQTNVEDMDESMPGGVGKEIGEMYEFWSEWLNGGGREEVMRTEDLEKLGIQVPTMSLREYLSGVNWLAAGIVSASTPKLTQEVR